MPKDEVSIQEYIRYMRDKQHVFLKEIFSRQKENFREHRIKRRKLNSGCKSIFEEQGKQVYHKNVVRIDKSHIEESYQVLNCNHPITIEKEKIAKFNYEPIYIPKYAYYTPLRYNFRADDERKLKFIPYYGDDHSQTFDERDLALFDLPMLGDDENASKRKEQLNVRFSEGDDQLIEAVIEKYGESNEVINALAKEFDTRADTIKNRIEELKKQRSIPAKGFEFCLKNASDTFNVLFCHKCKMYDCQLHRDENPDIPENDAAEKKKKLQIENDKLVRIVLQIKSKHFKKTKTSCSPHCYINSDAPATKNSEWTESERTLYKKSLLVFKHNFCAIAAVLQTRTCREVYDLTMKMCDEYQKKYPKGKIPPSPDTTHVKKGTSAESTVKQKMKSKSFKPCFWHPCKCKGSCNSSCPCIESTNFCAKWCQCSPTCKNRFKGCTCISGGCRSGNCPCFKAGRECDPDLCFRCTKKCCNRGILQSAHKHIALAPSKIHGWGAFLLDNAKKNDYICEYVGEVISQEEAERRGKFYDKSDCSYLFDLTQEYVIDAFRKGNKSRFINHSDNPNCECRIVYVNGDYRIGVYAKRDIQCGEELFFDYRYGKVEPTWMKEKGKHKDKHKKKIRKTASTKRE